MKIEELESRLGRLIKKMKIPDYRKINNTIHNYRWLYKNLGKMNEDHKLYPEAMEVLEKIIQEKR